MNEDHMHLVDGKGCCSVPMWIMGCPAGFCDEPAYGYRPKCKEFRDGWTGRWKRWDRKYDGYVPGLACVIHGGPELKDIAHIHDPCNYCGMPHDEVEVGPCPERVSSAERLRLGQSQGGAR